MEEEEVVVETGETKQRRIDSLNLEGGRVSTDEHNTYKVYIIYTS